jgi:hypothetical protein
VLVDDGLPVKVDAAAKTDSGRSRGLQAHAAPTGGSSGMALRLVMDQGRGVIMSVGLDVNESRDCDTH